MAAIVRRPQHGLRRLALAADPNVIPFIDVLLVLLIIFMVTAPIPTLDLRVDLPPPNARHVPLTGQRPTIITLSDGAGGFELSIDGETAPLAELGARTLQHAIRNNPALDVREIYAQARIFLRADQNTAYGSVVEVMTILQEAGFVKVGIFAERASD
jgi:biopolymer transport protein ExbD